MKKFFIKIIFVMILGIVFPIINFANADEVKCSSVGYTIFTINGIFTNKEEAAQNKRAFEDKLDKSFNSEPITVDYLHNESHVGGLGDLVMSAYQKFFEYETVEDYDLIEMLKSASEKVKTQKLLLVAHSQGNFYANSFYDTVAGKTGGVPTESVGIYAVATPAGRVAGGGKWLTSDTDNVIAGFVAKIPFKKIMPPNTSIGEFANSINPKAGHSFSDVYLKYRGGEIVSAISGSLEKLKTNAVQDVQKNCIDPPKLTLAHKAEGALLAVADPIFFGGKSSVVNGAEGVYKIGKTMALAAKQAVLAVGDMIKNPFVAGGEKKDIAKNSAAVGLIAEKPTELKSNTEYASHADNFSVNIIAEVSNREKSSDNIQNELALIQNSLEKIRQDAFLLKNLKETPAVHNSGQPATLTIKHLAFAGPPYPGFGGGGGASVSASPVSESTNEEQSTALSAPILNVPQCDYSLATDGCLLATTTVNFSWSAVSGATHYAISKNGQYATTTELNFTTTVVDFSDYVFLVAAVGTTTASLPAGQAGATSTQTVSVATIPLAINEIAWMGTQNSAFDEWLEIKNNTGHSINLSQWVVESSADGPYIALSGIIPPHQYIVLERTDDTVMNIEAYAVYSGSLNNDGEQITLYYASTTLDKTPYISGSGWTAGGNASSTARKTMERVNSEASGDNTTNWATWGTNINFIKNGLDADGNAISGTPGECNSASFIDLNNGQDIYQNTTLEKDNCYYVSSGVSVSSTSTLIIEEGVSVSLHLDSLVVNGVLDVNGTSSNPVVFDSFSGSATTNQIEISNNNGTSTMDNVVISNTGGISLNNGADLEITGAEFSNNSSGIELNNGSSVEIASSTFASTTNEAITAYNGSFISVASSTITGNTRDAIGIYDSEFSVASSTIIGVSNGDGIGLYDSVSIVSNLAVEDVSGDGIGVYGGTATIASTTIDDFGNDGVGIYSGADVSGEAIVDGVAVEY